MPIYVCLSVGHMCIGIRCTCHVYIHIWNIYIYPYIGWHIYIYLGGYHWMSASGAKSYHSFAQRKLPSSSCRFSDCNAANMGGARPIGAMRWVLTSSWLTYESCISVHLLKLSKWHCHKIFCELLNFGVSTEKVWEPRCLNSYPHTQHDNPAAWAQIHIQNMTTFSDIWSSAAKETENRPTHVFKHLRTFGSKTQSFSQRVLLNDLLRLCGSTSVFCNHCERARYVKRCELFRPKNLTICAFQLGTLPDMLVTSNWRFFGNPAPPQMLCRFRAQEPGRARQTRQATFKLWWRNLHVENWQLVSCDSAVRTWRAFFGTGRASDGRAGRTLRMLFRIGNGFSVHLMTLGFTRSLPRLDSRIWFPTSEGLLRVGWSLFGCCSGSEIFFFWSKRLVSQSL